MKSSDISVGREYSSRAMPAWKYKVTGFSKDGKSLEYIISSGPMKGRRGELSVSDFMERVTGPAAKSRKLSKDDRKSNGKGYQDSQPNDDEDDAAYDGGVD